jgi:hypothetical protein
MKEISMKNNEPIIAASMLQTTDGSVCRSGPKRVVLG